MMENYDMEEIGKIIKIDIDSQDYPEHLREIQDPPKQLYCCGNIERLKDRCVAVVGSRKYTMYGKYVAQMIGKHLANAGVTVVSGLAKGIDGFSHTGMMEANGKGIGVLGSGILHMTPRSNYQLMQNMIKEGGLVVSEYKPDEASTKYSFPARNRIISGLSEAVIVVEANFNSGALITAQYANSQGRTVYAVPGNINSQFSMGSNLLIRDGATPLIVLNDVLEDMGVEMIKEKISTIECGRDELEIVNTMMKYNGVSVDGIAKELDRKVGDVSGILTVMEIKGIVQSSCGKFYLTHNPIS